MHSAMHNEITCVIKIRENILQLVQLMESFHGGGDHLKKKWSQTYIHHSFLEGFVLHDIVVNNAMSASNECMHDCDRAAQYFNQHAWLVVSSVLCLTNRQYYSKCLLYTQWQLKLDCIILVLFSSYKTQTALKRWPYEELSMPTLNNRLSAILLKLNPAQIPHQVH